MSMFAGLDLGGKTTAVCVVDETGKIVWQGTVDTHPDAMAARLKGFQEKLVKVGIESGPFTPHLRRSLAAKAFRWCAWMRATAATFVVRRLEVIVNCGISEVAFENALHSKTSESHQGRNRK
jgi:transposase